MILWKDRVGKVWGTWRGWGGGGVDGALWRGWGGDGGGFGAGRSLRHRFSVQLEGIMKCF